MAVRSKRAAEITAETERRGHANYQARNVVARCRPPVRDIRARKRHEPVADLMARWLPSWRRCAGRWPIARSRSRRPRAVEADEQRRIVAQVLAADWSLTARKVFSRRDVVVAVAPGSSDRSRPR